MLSLVCLVLTLYNFILLARVILSWIPQVPDGLRPVVDIVYKATEPVVRLARPLIPPLRIGGIALDLSIILVFVILQILLGIVCRG